MVNSYIRYLKPYIGKAFLFGSGLIVGINNYHHIDELKDYIKDFISTETVTEKKMNLLEDLIYRK